MTIKGKRKAFSNDRTAQIAAIKKAHNGIVPSQPLPRRYPSAAWKDGDMFHVAKLITGKLSVRLSTEKSETTPLFRTANGVSSHLSRIYHRRISLLDLQAAVKSPIPVPTLEETQLAMICWETNKNIIRLSPEYTTTPTTWQFCSVSPDGIEGGTRQERPKLTEGYSGPLIIVLNIEACIDLLGTAFNLNIGRNDMEESLNKMVKVHQIVSTSKQKTENRTEEGGRT
jgi:hypothetical protein